MFKDSVGNRYTSVPPAKTPPGAGKSRSGNKKHGRWNRKPSNKRYKSENRCAKNKARRAARRFRVLA